MHTSSEYGTRLTRTREPPKRSSISKRSEPVAGADEGARPPVQAPAAPPGGATATRWSFVASIDPKPTGRWLHPIGRPSGTARGQSIDLAHKLPCRRHDPDLWFADSPADVERAKALCAGCPIRLACLAVAVHRAEVAGVWGGHLFDRGCIIPRKRPRGRPRAHRISQTLPADPRLPAMDPTMSNHRTAQPNRPATAADGVNQADQAGHDSVQSAAARLYDAECALHAAHQSQVDDWISAATQKLHHCVTEYLTAADASPIC